MTVGYAAILALWGFMALIGLLALTALLALPVLLALGARRTRRMRAIRPRGRLDTWGAS